MIIYCVGPKTKSSNRYLDHYVCINQKFRSYTFDQHNSTKIKSFSQFLYFSWLMKRDPVRSRVEFNVQTISLSCVSAGCQTDQTRTYHPESQGALERFHSTLKNMIRTYCLDRLGKRLGPKVKGQSWGFTSRSTARVILGQVLRIATCGTRTHRGDSL